MKDFHWGFVIFPFKKEYLLEDIIGADGGF
jgi:hypothetical protein